MAGLYPPPLDFALPSIGENNFRFLELLISLGGFSLLFFYILRYWYVSFSWLIFIIITSLLILVNSITNNNPLEMLSAWFFFLGPMAIVLFRPTKKQFRYLFIALYIILLFNFLFGFMFFLFGEKLAPILTPRHSASITKIKPLCIIGSTIVLSYINAIIIVLNSYYFQYKAPLLTFVFNMMLLMMSMLYGSRSAFILVLLSIFICYWKWKKLLILISFSGLLLFISLFNYIEKETRFNEWEFQDTSAFLRYNAAVFSYYKFKDNPYIGTGPSTVFPRGDRQHRSSAMLGNNPVVIRDGLILPSEPHGTLWLFLVEFGIVGFSVFLYFLIKLFKEWYSQLKYNNNSKLGILLIAIVIMVAFTYSLQYNVRFSTILWGCFILIKMPIDYNNDPFGQRY